MLIIYAVWAIISAVATGIAGLWLWFWLVDVRDSLQSIAKSLAQAEPSEDTSST